MLQPPVSFSLVAAISLECLHVLDSNYLPCETQGATVKSHTSLHIGNILVFKNVQKKTKLCAKKIQKPTHRNLFLAIAKWNISLATRRMHNLWTSEALVCKVGLVKKSVFLLLCPKQRLWLNCYFCTMCDSDYIILLSTGRDEPAAYGKNHEHRSARPKRPSGGECSRGQSEIKSQKTHQYPLFPLKKGNTVQI